MAFIKFEFLRSDLFRHVSYQFVGTGLAQLLPFVATPVLARLYSKEDFATYTTFFAISSILIAGAGARYQFAILLPRKNINAIRILNLSVLITILYSILVLVLIVIFSKDFNLNIGLGIYFVPLYVLFFGLWNSFSFLSIRNKSFFQNSTAKVLHALFYVIVAIGIGFSKYTLYGLIIAKLTGVLGSFAYLYKKSSIKINLTRFKKLNKLAKEYSDYPKYGLIPAFLDVLSVQGLTLILAKFYVFELGYFGLTALVLSAPLGLVGGAFKDVFYQRITTLINQRKFIEAAKFFNQSAVGLFLIGLPICLVVYFFGSDIFKFAFGEQWARSGEFASLLSASFLVQLIVSPLSSIFNAANKLKIASIWQTLYFISTFITLGISSAMLKLEVEELLLVYVIHEVVLYVGYFLLQRWTLKGLN